MDYTQTPNKLRITRDGDFADPGGDPEVELVWQLDAIDTRTSYEDPDGRTRYDFTEQVWNFATLAEAVAAMPEFIAQLAEYLPDVRAQLAAADRPNM